MTLLDQLKAVAEAYGKARNFEPSTVSRVALGDGMRLPAILRGKADMTTRRFEKTLIWFSENWPEGADWPTDVPRPTADTEAA